MKNILRSIQTLFPFLHDFRFNVKMFLMKFRTKPHENDFNLIKYFNPKANKIFVDIGANRGESILSMKILNPKIKIVAFEPNKLIYNKLYQKWGDNSDIKLYNYGLGNANQNLEFYIPFYRKWMFDGLASFKYEEAKDWLKTRMWNYNENKLSIKKVQCQVKKLDDFDLQPYFIKIDVQGFELEVLKGAKATLEKHKPILLIESLNSEHKKFLDNFDYKFYNYDQNKLLEGFGELNTFCITDSKYDELIIN